MSSAPRSAGLLMYRYRGGVLQVFLIHPGGPFWAGKDLAAWSIPKGQYDLNEQPLAAAIREFHEETGFHPHPPFLDLGTIRQPGGKLVHAWAFAGDCDPAQLVSNTCQIEWPPRSGQQLTIPEADRGDWFALSDARPRILRGQLPLLDALADELAHPTPPPAPLD